MPTKLDNLGHANEHTAIRMAVLMPTSFDDPARAYANELGRYWSCQQVCNMAVLLPMSFNDPGRVYTNKLGQSLSCLRQQAWTILVMPLSMPHAVFMPRSLDDPGLVFANDLGRSWSCLRQ